MLKVGDKVRFTHKAFFEGGTADKGDIGTIQAVQPSDSSYIVKPDNITITSERELNGTMYPGMWMWDVDIEAADGNSTNSPPQSHSWQENKGLDLLCGTASDGIVGGWDCSERNFV
jgi:hypothetical protein